MCGAAEEGGLAFAPAQLIMAFVTSCLAYLTLMLGVMLYQQPGTFWDYKLFDLFQTSRCVGLTRSHCLFNLFCHLNQSMWHPIRQSTVIVCDIVKASAQC